MIMSNKNKTDNIFFCRLSILLTMYMLVINNMKNNTLSLVAIVLSLIFILKPLYLLPNVFIASLLGEYFVAFNGIGLSRILVIIFIIGSLFELLVKHRKIKIVHILMCLTLCSFNIVSSLTSITGIITPAITMSLNILILFFMYYVELDNLDVFLKTMVGSMITLSMYIMYMVISGKSATVNDNSVIRVILDESTNANNLGMALAQLTNFFFGMVMISKKKIIYIIFMFTNLINLILTGSRSATIATIMSIIIIIIISGEKKHKKYYYFIIILIILVGGYIQMSSLGLDIMDRYSINSIKANGGTGRTYIWETLFKYVIPSNMFFGVGFGGMNIYYAISQYVPVAHGAHNIIISILASTGIVGLLIYVSFFGKSLHSFIKCYKKTGFVIIPLVMFLTALLNGIGEDMFDNRFLWFDIGLGFMFMYYKPLFSKPE